MQSNAPLERLINAVMTLDGGSEDPEYAAEMRCLMRKVEWVAVEAETALKRRDRRVAAKQPRLSGLENAA